MDKKFFLAFVIALISTTTSWAQSTTFTYQGRLTDMSLAANGAYSMRFDLFAAPTGGTALASKTLSPINVANGIFIVQLDFNSPTPCPTCFDGSDRYLEITVGTTTLSPRQKINSVPYAIRALTAANATTVGGLGTGSFVQKSGDTITGTLNLPNNGLQVGANQITTSAARVGIGVTPTLGKLQISTPALGDYAVYAENNFTGSANAVGIVGRSVNNPGFGYG